MQIILIYGVAITVCWSDDAGEEIQFTERKKSSRTARVGESVWVCDQNESQRNDGSGTADPRLLPVATVITGCLRPLVRFSLGCASPASSSASGSWRPDVLRFGAAHASWMLDCFYGYPFFPGRCSLIPAFTGLFSSAPHRPALGCLKRSASVLSVTRRPGTRESWGNVWRVSGLLVHEAVLTLLSTVPNGKSVTLPTSLNT